MNLFVKFEMNVRAISYPGSNPLDRGCGQLSDREPGKKPPTLEWRQEKQDKQEKQKETSNLKSGVQPSDM